MSRFPASVSGRRWTVCQQQAIRVPGRVTLAVITSTVRDHPPEVRLGHQHGRDCMASCDDLVTVSGEPLLVAGARLRDLDAALIALGLNR